MDGAGAYCELGLRFRRLGAFNAENDLRVGGKFKTTMAAKGKSDSFEFAGIYTDLKTQELIEYDIDDSRHVKVKFAEVPEGTKITETFESEKINPIDIQKSDCKACLRISKNMSK